MIEALLGSRHVAEDFILWLRRVSGLLAIGVVVAGGAAAGCYYLHQGRREAPPPTPPPGRATRANVWVSANGSDSGSHCVRSARPIANVHPGGTTLCQTLNKAYSLT